MPLKLVPSNFDSLLINGIKVYRALTYIWSSSCLNSAHALDIASSVYSLAIPYSYYMGFHTPPPEKLLTTVLYDRYSLFIGRRIVFPVLPNFTYADRTWPSLLCTSSVIRPMFQRCRGNFSSWTITTSSTFGG